jgi:hypothetical protein
MSFLTLLQSQSATQTITLNRIESTAQVFLPTVIQAGGAQTITLNRVESIAQVFNLTVVQGGIDNDTSDILSRGLKRLRQEEENLAAQLLKGRNKKVERKKKKQTDWKQALLKKINGAETVEELNAVEIPTESIEATASVLAEIERKKEARRLELEIAQREKELKLLELKAVADLNEAQIVQQIAEKKQMIDDFKRTQLEVLARHEIAVQQAIENERQLFLETLKAEQEAQEFTRKRNNRIKRIKALMWLAKLDI